MSAIVISFVGLTVVLAVIYPNISKSENVFPTTLNSGYEIFNMKGDKINTWIEWKVMKGDPFHINVAQSSEVTPQRVADIHDVIYSNDIVVLDSETYYKGWMGALSSIKSDEEFAIPIHFHTMSTIGDVGNVVIHLTDTESGDGLNGLTKNIADEGNHQILKSSITIYGVDKLNDEELKIILRHELGHAFGLAHSDNPDDLMHATVDTEHAYISQCDIEAIQALYNGEQKSQVVCQK